MQTRIKIIDTIFATTFAHSVTIANNSDFYNGGNRIRTSGEALGVRQQDTNLQLHKQ
jgi:hypothetical protein